MIEEGKTGTSSETEARNKGIETPNYLQKPRKAKKKKAAKIKVKPVNTRSSDTPSNPYVEHVVSWEPPVLSKRQGNWPQRHETIAGSEAGGDSSAKPEP